MGRDRPELSKSPVKGKRSPHRRSPPRRERSPTQHKSSRRDSSPPQEKHSIHAKSPRAERTNSSAPRSPSPRTKWLRKAQIDKDAEAVTEKNNGKILERGSDRDCSRGTDRERGFDREAEPDRKERRSVRDDDDRKSSRSRHKNSTSPSEHHPKSRHRSGSPPKALENRARREVSGDRDYSRGTDRERGFDREAEPDRKERRSVRDDDDRKSSRSRHKNSTSPSEHHPKSRHRSGSPPKALENRARHEVKNSRGAERRENDDDSVAKMKAAEEALETKEKQKPSFELSGKLAAETNRVRGVTLLFTEPPEARKPDVRWRLYVFKAGEVLNEPLYIHRQSCYLFGRERRVADVPTDHPSCSKQHAVIQFRQVEKEQPDGLLKKHVRPYLMDLGSTNKTFINDNAVEPQRYYELFERDTIKFGNSSREYVILHENSAAS